MWPNAQLLTTPMLHNPHLMVCTHINTIHQNDISISSLSFILNGTISQTEGFSFINTGPSLCTVPMDTQWLYQHHMVLCPRYFQPHSPGKEAVLFVWRDNGPLLESAALVRAAGQVCHCGSSPMLVEAREQQCRQPHTGEQAAPTLRSIVNKRQKELGRTEAPGRSWEHGLQGRGHVSVRTVE